jgi:hypothetical protein
MAGNYLCLAEKFVVSNKEEAEIIMNKKERSERLAF